MIISGTLHAVPDGPTISTEPISDPGAAIAKLRRNVKTITVLTEVIGLSVDQVWARFYVRGGMDPRFAEPDAVDEYLRILNGIRGDRGAAARNAFLRGWAEHRSVPTPRDPVVWHRYIGDTAIQVHPEAQR